MTGLVLEMLTHLRRGKKEKKKMTMKIVATNVVANRLPNGDRLQRRPLVPIIISIIELETC